MSPAWRALIGGGARSGKSRFALQRAEELGERRAFVATAQAFDDEMRERIAQHMAERGAGWTTHEEPHSLVGLLRDLEQRDDVDVILVDCLTLWLSNLLLRGDDNGRIEEQILELVQTWSSLQKPCLLVTNEVGLGIVPEHALGRRFRDLAGRTHRQLGAAADEVWFGAMGALLRLKPTPVVTRWEGE